LPADFGEVVGIMEDVAALREQLAAVLRRVAELEKQLAERAARIAELEAEVKRLRKRDYKPQPNRQASPKSKQQDRRRKPHRKRGAGEAVPRLRQRASETDGPI
jgi:regulator of replication initiation timing